MTTTYNPRGSGHRQQLRAQMQCMEGQQSETSGATSASSSSYTVTMIPANHTTNHTKHHDQFLSLDGVRHHMAPDLLLGGRMHISINL